MCSRDFPLGWAAVVQGGEGRMEVWERDDGRGLQQVSSTRCRQDALYQAIGMGSMPLICLRRTGS